MSINHPIIEVAKREWDRIKSKWTLLMITVVGPLIAFLLITIIFSQNVPRNLPVAVVDNDNSKLSHLILRYVDATPIAETHRSCFSLLDAKKAIEEGSADAVIFIPKDTEKNILKGENANIIVYLNDANVVKAGLLNSGIRKAIGTVSAGIKLKKHLQNGKTFNESYIRIMPVKLDPVLLFNPFISYSYFLTLGLMPIILIVFVLLGTTHAIGTELLRGTGPQWLKTANNNIFIALTGKIIPYTALYMIIAIIMNLIFFHKLGLTINGSYYILLLSEFLIIVSYQFISFFLLGLFSNLRLSLSIGSAYCMLALTYSGLTFPEFGMPAFGQAFAQIFPFSYWLKAFIGQTIRGESLVITINHLLPLLAFILLGTIFIPRLKHFLLNEHHWGKI